MSNARRAMKIANMPLHAVVVMCRKKSESRTLFVCQIVHEISIDNTAEK